MRWLLTLALLALAAWPAAAQENEAEKLFRDLEQKVRAAKTLQIRFEATITGADAKKWNTKGSMILGEGDKFRAEYESKRFGKESKHNSVSDGTDWTSFGYEKELGEDKVYVSSASKGTQKTPKAMGAHLRTALPRDGFVLAFMTDRRSELASDLFTMSDFKLAGEEKIGAQNTQVIQYMVKEKAKDPSEGFPAKKLDVLSMKLWLDTKTQLPVKLAMTGGERGINAITETYSEFTIDGKVDAKLFELPQVALLPGVGATGGEATQKDQQKIQGTWEPSGVSYGGKAFPSQPKRFPTRIFTGTKLVTKDPGKEEKEETFKLDAGKEPKHIDLTDKKDGKTVQGIYLLEGDTLKIAYCFPAAGRPTTFDGKDVLMETLNRPTKK